MDARLAQVRACVDEWWVVLPTCAWRVARDRRDQNELLTRRIDALERHVTATLLPIRARHNASVSSLEEEILRETNAATASRRELELRQEELTKADMKAVRSERHVEFLEKAIQEQQARKDEIWKEMTEDLELLQEEDKLARDHELRQQQEKEAALQQLQGRLLQLEEIIATRKAENDKKRSLVEASKRRKRALEQDVEALDKENKRLKSDLAKRRRSAAKQLPLIVEDGLDSILRELDEMRR